MSAGRWITEAAQLVDGRVEDRDRLVAAIRSASENVEDPRGPINLLGVPWEEYQSEFRHLSPPLGRPSLDEVPCASKVRGAAATS